MNALTQRTAAVLLLFALVGCGGARSAEPPGLEALRAAKGSNDVHEVSAWLAGELLAPGGSVQGVRAARERYDALKTPDAVGEFMLGLDDELHGRLAEAPERYLRAVKAARAARSDLGELIAWHATDRASILQRHDPKLYTRWQKQIDEWIAEPAGIGWRARLELVDWWAERAWERAEDKVKERAAEKHGCVTDVRFAGPFGSGRKVDAFRAHAAELPGPWPAQWDTEPNRSVRPQQLAGEKHGCFVAAKEPQRDGVFYAESFLELSQPRELLFAAQGALEIRVDDHRVLVRDPRTWGSWHRFGVAVKLAAGRHRVLVKLPEPRTTLRVLELDGRPAKVSTDVDGSAPYELRAPEVLAEPNALARFVRDGQVQAPRGALVLRYVLAGRAAAEGQGDVASIALEPLVGSREKASGAALAGLAAVIEKDPIFAGSHQEDEVRGLLQAAAKRDAGLWGAQLRLAAWEAAQKGAAGGVPQFEALAKRYPAVPEVALSLAQLYARLGWSVEYENTIRSLEKRFPENEAVLRAALDVHDANGEAKAADATVATLQRLDPDADVTLTRALARRDWDGALAELKRIAKRRSDRKDIAERFHDVLMRAGNKEDALRKLEAAVRKAPRDGDARLALADARFAGSGDLGMIRRAIVDAVTAGANVDGLGLALDLLEGTTELEPYRIDGRRVIADYEKAGEHQAATAARVLDYTALWVKSDGSSRLLSHEIVRIQSKEAIQRFAEQNKLEGMVLHQRVLKQDGRVLEPENVAGKPTLTFPHLEIGDYIETEHIIDQRGDGELGRRWLGPRWFFREKDVAYARSEFVVVAPKDRPLVVETTGNVPAPEVRELGAVKVHRWRVDLSPAAPEEPFSVPIDEFLPSVRVGWGIALKDALEALADRVTEDEPIDPRVVRRAQEIVGKIPAANSYERARTLYRWVLDKVTNGEDTDGRRVVMSKQGNRWRGFLALCRALGIHAEYAVARNRLLPPPRGALSEADQFGSVVLRVGTSRGPVWLTFSGDHAPFGYMPMELRGVPAYRLGNDFKIQQTATSTDGGLDLIRYRGDVTLAADGSAKLKLELVLEGKFAVAYRTAFASTGKAQLAAELEGKLVARILRGARLLDHQIEKLDDEDSPLTLRLDLEMVGFANPTENGLSIVPPFVPRLTSFATLPTRQTALLLASALHTEIDLRIKLPVGLRPAQAPLRAKLADGDRTVTVADELTGDVLRLNRRIDVPTGRVPVDHYGAFARFVRAADQADGREIELVPAAGGTVTAAR